MAFEAANHYEIVGAGIRAVVDTSGIAGLPVVSLNVDGRPIDGAAVASGPDGLTVDGVVDEIFDKETVLVRLVLPRVNVAGEEELFAGLALLTTARTSIGGPGLVQGAIHLYDVRPLAGVASVVES